MLESAGMLIGGDPKHVIEKLDSLRQFGRKTLGQVLGGLPLPGVEPGVLHADGDLIRQRAEQLHGLGREDLALLALHVQHADDGLAGQ